MNNVTRICPQCGGDTPIEARCCPQCGFDTQGGLPVHQPRQLPVVLGKAALPVLAGVASLAIRAGWKLLQSRLARDLAQQGVQQVVNAIAKPAAKTTKNTPVVQTTTPTAPARSRTRRTIHIRSSWAVGDASGFRQYGSAEHTIEIED